MTKRQVCLLPAFKQSNKQTLLFWHYKKSTFPGGDVRCQISDITNPKKTMTRITCYVNMTDEEMKIVNRTAEKLGYASRTELVTTLPRDRGIPNQNTD